MTQAPIIQVPPESRLAIVAAVGLFAVPLGVSGIWFTALAGLWYCPIAAAGLLLTVFLAGGGHRFMETATGDCVQVWALPQ